MGNVHKKNLVKIERLFLEICWRTDRQTVITILRSVNGDGVIQFATARHDIHACLRHTAYTEKRLHNVLVFDKSHIVKPTTYGYAISVGNQPIGHSALRPSGIAKSNTAALLE